MDLSVTLGYAIAITTVLGSAAVIGILALKAVFKAYSLFRPSTPKKNESQITKSLEPNEDIWTCPYCSTSNELADRSCITCGSPRRFCYLFG